MRKEQIGSAYKKLSRMSIYDKMITYSGFWGKLICRVVWGYRDSSHLGELLKAFPSVFSGTLLEVPIGTGILTAPKYKNYPNAKITCLDYSEGMMTIAKMRFGAMNIENVHFIQGDVGHLPFEDNHFDVVISLNGFHAFLDKEAAFSETLRVLKKGGLFIGCFYIKGENKRTDWFIKNIYSPLGFFTPPFQTKNELKMKLGCIYRNTEVNSINSIVYFNCIK
jgi:SAM-dependent methyltransferase